MKEFDWLNNSDSKKKDERVDDDSTEEQLPEKVDESTRIEDNVIEKLKEEEPKDERETVNELKGDKFNPVSILAVLALVETASEVRKKEIPKLFHIKRPVNIIGTGRSAYIKVDDLKTVEAEHGAVVFKDGRFILYPQEGEVRVNGEQVPVKGEVLNNGSRIEMGSAKFVFLTTLKD